MKTTVNLNSCPNCGGNLSLEESTGRIVCKYCGKYFTFDELKEGISFNGEGEDEYDEYSCSYCGGVIVSDANSITSACPYCGKTAVMKNRITGKYCPDYIIPFCITPEQARDSFDAMLHRKTVAASFKREFKIETVTSLFVPFWLYNTDIYVEITYDYIVCEKSGKTKHCRKNVCFTETYDKVPVDASLKIDDDKMDRIEPYDYSELKPFDKVYFIGHRAEKYDTEVSLMADRAKGKIEKSARTSFSRYLYDNSTTADGILLNAMGRVANNMTAQVADLSDKSNLSSDFDREYIADNTNIDRIKKSKVKADLSDYRYALFPVYIIRGRYRGKDYLYYVNGQTGKVAANFPLGYAQYYISQIIGVLAGSFLVSGIFLLGVKAFIKLWEENNDLGVGISNGNLFLIVWLVTFLIVGILEMKYNSNDSLREAKQSVGEIKIVPNAKNFRVPGSFKIISK
jgi:DNA-directed RNA polymerase subunit RPC12/RpoP